MPGKLCRFAEKTASSMPKFKYGHKRRVEEMSVQQQISVIMHGSGG